MAEHRLPGVVPGDLGRNHYRGHAVPFFLSTIMLSIGEDTAYKADSFKAAGKIAVRFCPSDDSLGIEKDGG